jgi:hypothetical protein
MRWYEESAYFAHNCTAAICGLVMRRMSFRFSKDYRWGTTRFHRFVYICVNTIAANLVADGYDWRGAVFWGYPRQNKYGSLRDNPKVWNRALREIKD